MMELSDTIELMTSSNYVERFKAEYFQTRIRYEKLRSMVTKMEAAEREGKPQSAYLKFEPKCSMYVLLDQLRFMESYMHQLEIRAVIERIDISME